MSHKGPLRDAVMAILKTDWLDDDRKRAAVDQVLWGHVDYNSTNPKELPTVPEMLNVISSP